jgi:hypothetical protein
LDLVWILFVDLIVLKSVAIECSVASIIDKLLCISNFETRSMLRYELVMIHMMGKRWLSFMVLFDITLTILDTVWIMFKKRVLFYLYPNRKIVTVIQVSVSQFIVASRLCSLLNWNNNGYSVTNGFAK